MKNPFKPDRIAVSNPDRQSMGILDDFAVRKVASLHDGTIEKTPTEDNDIVNKAYCDSNSVSIDAPDQSILYNDAGNISGSSDFYFDSGSVFHQVTNPTNSYIWSTNADFSSRAPTGYSQFNVEYLGEATYTADSENPALMSLDAYTYDTISGSSLSLRGARLTGLSSSITTQDTQYTGGTTNIYTITPFSFMADMVNNYYGQNDLISCGATGMTISVADGSTFHMTDSQTLTLTGLTSGVVENSQTLSGTLLLNGTGINVTFTEGTSSNISGAYYGIKYNLSAKTGSNLKGYCLYVTSLDTDFKERWVIYNPTTANSFLGQTGAMIYLGTSFNSSLSFDGTYLSLNSAKVLISGGQLYIPNLKKLDGSTPAAEGDNLKINVVSGGLIYAG